MRREVNAHAHRHGVVGPITIDGIDLGPETIARIRDLVGIVFQDPDDQLIGLTVGEDVVCGPGLLLLDEPSSGLDPRGRRGLAGLLTGLPATQVIATHDLVLVERVCPRAIIVDAGTIVADGPTAAVLGDAALLERHGLA